MLKALFSIAFGLTFGAVLLFVGLLASSAFAAPPGSKVHKCTSAVTSAKFQEVIDAALAQWFHGGLHCASASSILPFSAIRVSRGLSHCLAKGLIRLKCPGMDSGFAQRCLT